jgi:proteasome lid subunit RPN8/RPN11
MKISSKTYLKMKKYSENFLDQESCGLIYEDEKGLSQFRECKNIHFEPVDFFEICPSEYLKTSKEGEIKAVFHSHPKSGGPSNMDIEMSTNLELPFVIYSLKNKKFYHIGC